MLVSLPTRVGFGSLAPFLAALAVSVAILLPQRAAAQPAIGFVQVNSATPQSTTATVTVRYTGAQTAGDLNVVVVGWNDATAQVSSVTDTSGNLYVKAVGPTVRSGSATQSIYYAANIAAAPVNTNTVTVAFSAGAFHPDIRIAEYSGVATTSPLDIVASAQGSGTTGDSGAATTSNANDLLVGANTVQTHATGPGPSYTQRVITSPDGDILEDRIVSATGSYNATAPMTSGWWIMQMVAFRAAGSSGGDTVPPTAPGTPLVIAVSSGEIDLTWPAATDNVAVTGYLVERCAGVGCSSFAQIASNPGTTYSDTSLTASTSYSYRIRATDLAGNLSPFSPTGSATTQAAAGIAFVQVNYATPQSPQSSVSVSYGAAQTAGDLNVVVVGWNDASATVQSVTDTSGNTYARAVGPTVRAGTATQSIYYAANIAGASANGNSVTVTFASPAVNADIRIAEYSGVATVSPVDIVASAQGSGTTGDSGAATTTNANDLLVGANTVQTHATGPGPSYTQRAITSPDGDILEDRIVSATGSYNATAPMTSGWWIMQMVAFRAAGTPIPADLALSVTHSGTFSQGQTGAIYTITAANLAGSGPTSGAVTVAVTVPTGLTATALSGPGWTCPQPAGPCSRSDVLAAGASYPALTLTVTVAGTAPASVTLTATVSGGGDVTPGNDTASDPTTITAPTPADLTLAATHSGTFSQGQTGAIYTITAANLAGSGPTSGAVTVAVTVPTGLTATAVSGPGWTCPQPAGPCSRSDVLAAGASYPALTLTVTVAGTAPASVTLTATVSGGGDVTPGNDTASDPTTITAPTPADLTLAATHSGAFSQGQTGAIYTITAANLAGSGPTSGAVTVAVTVPTGLTATALSGPGWTCPQPAGPCSRSDVLAAGASYPALTLTVTVAGTAPASVTLTTTVSGGGDVTPGNDTASDLTAIETGAASPPVFAAETNSAFDRNVTGSNRIDLSLNVTGANTLLIVALHSEFDGGDTNWDVKCNNVPGTLVANLNGYAGGDGNQRFRVYYWVNPAPGSASIVVQNSYTGSNELAASAVLLTNAAQTGSLGAIVADVSTSGRTSETELVPTVASDLVLHVIADALCIRGTLGNGETSVSVANDGVHCVPGDGDASLWISTKPGQDSSTTVSSSGWASSPSPAPRVLNGVAIVVHSGGTLAVPSPDLTVTKTHVGTFAPGQTGATYTVTVSNVGTASTSGSVTLSDALPTGLTAIALNGTGWTCTQPAGPCTRTDVLAAGASYPALTLTVTVAGTAPASVTNTATVSGGGDVTPGNDTASDPTTITAPTPADLTLAATHSGTFSQGQTGATYAITAANLAGSGPTSGAVTVAVTVPTGLTATALSGPGWTCPQPAGPCTRSDVLAAGASYPALTLTVTVAGTAPASVTLTATVSGGGDVTPGNDTASDLTAIAGLTPGLVAAYAFNEGTGTTVADISGNGNNGTVTNATWTASGKYGPALSFNGSSSRVTIADAASLHLTNAMTLEAWVRPLTVSSAWRDIIEKGNDNYYLMGTTTSNSRPATGGTFGSTKARTTAPSALPTSTWTHLAGTYNGATLILYVNGVQVSSASRSGTLATSTSPLQFGSDSIYGQYFNGTIDEIRIYNVALTPSQVQADMNTPINAAPDTEPPTAPGALAAAASSTSQIDLTWVASSDNVGVTQYRIERCQGAGCSTFAQVATSTSTAFSDTGLPATTSYTYRVRAADAAGNAGSYSNPTTAVTLTPDTEPPSAPGLVTATAVSGIQIDLSWAPATDNVGVVSYRVERCQGTGCTDFVKLASPTGTTFTDTGLTPNTPYRYIVSALDAANNLGPYSNTASATTLATNPSLVAAYAFDEGSGPTAADASGNGNTGAVTAATWTSGGQFGGALVFNGTSSRVTVSDSASLRLTTAMTLEAWVNPSATTSGWRDVIYKGSDNYYLDTRNAAPVAGLTLTPATNSNTFGPSALPINTWTHLAVTFDGSNVRLYVNGVQAATTAIAGNLLTSSNALEIGSDHFFGQYFQGAIDEVRVYNVALTPTQIQTDMATPIGATPLVSLSPSSLDFANQAVGTTSVSQAVTLTNSGDRALTISSIAVAGADASDFSQSNACGVSLAAGASCTISVTFTPTASGSRGATVAIADDAPGAPQSIGLTGTSGFSISPKAAVLTSALAQQFTPTGSGGATLIWSVDGVAGGAPATGAITSAGLYTPPPTAGTHLVTAATADLVLSASATAYVTNYAGTLTHHNDNLRTGQNPNETVLTPANVNTTSFGKLFSYALDGQSVASPLYVANVSVPGQGVHNVVYVATEHDSVYAFDADGRTTSPLWQTSFVNPGLGITTVPAADTLECCDISPEIGITGTPVIDPGTGTLYVVAKTKEVSGATTSYVQRLHALDIATGAEKLGGPVALQASVPGTGQGSQGGNVPFDALRENQRPALLLSNGVIYIGFGGHGDHQPYHGWVLGYNATTLQQTVAFNVSPNGDGGGIWQANGGPAADAAGNIYFITSNGLFDANAGGKDYGDSFVKMSPSGTVLDYFTPHDQASISSSNFDLGAAGPLLMPDQTGAHPHLTVSAGKNNTIYLVDRDNMGHYNASNDNQIVQSLVDIFPYGTPEPGNYSGAVYFNGTVYFAPIADNIQAFPLTNGLLPTSATSRSSQIFQYPGAVMAISANGTSNGILWAVERNSDCGTQTTCSTASPGVLRAYDASNLSVQLYSSDQAPGARDTLDYAAKFSVPLVANGRVFVASMSRLTVYGLLP